MLTLHIAMSDANLAHRLCNFSIYIVFSLIATVTFATGITAVLQLNILQQIMKFVF